MPQTAHPNEYTPKNMLSTLRLSCRTATIPHLDPFSTQLLEYLHVIWSKLQNILADTDTWNPCLIDIPCSPPLFNSSVFTTLALPQDPCTLPSNTCNQNDNTYDQINDTCNLA